MNRSSVKSSLHSVVYFTPALVGEPLFHRFLRGPADLVGAEAQVAVGDELDLLLLKLLGAGFGGDRVSGHGGMNNARKRLTQEITSAPKRTALRERVS